MRPFSAESTAGADARCVESVAARSWSGTAWFWTSFLITWLAHRAHKRAIPCFLGISFGCMLATIAALLVACLMGKPLSFTSGKRLYSDI